MLHWERLGETPGNAGQANPLFGPQDTAVENVNNPINELISQEILPGARAQPPRDTERAVKPCTQTPGRRDRGPPRPPPAQAGGLGLSLHLRVCRGGSPDSGPNTAKTAATPQRPWCARGPSGPAGSPGWGSRERAALWSPGRAGMWAPQPPPANRPTWDRTGSRPWCPIGLRAANQRASWAAAAPIGRSRPREGAGLPFVLCSSTPRAPPPRALSPGLGRRSRWGAAGCGLRRARSSPGPLRTGPSRPRAPPRSHAGEEPTGWKAARAGLASPRP